MKTKTALLLLLVSVWGLEQLQAATTVRLPSVTGIVDDIISVPLYLDDDISGNNVTAFQFEIGINAVYAELTSVGFDNTIAQSFGAPVVNVSANYISIAAAGATPLTGQGVLLNLVFHLKNPGSVPLSFRNTASANFFNEGNQALSFINGNISISAKPTLKINLPATGLLIGETINCPVTGGTAPYTWAVSDNSLATITSDGKLTALKSGFVQAIATDSKGYSAESAKIEILSFKVSIPDTTFYQNNYIEIPIHIQNLEETKLHAGQWTITYAENILSFQELATGDCLLGASSVHHHVQPGSVTVTFAHAGELTQSGELFKLKFKIADTNSGYTNITFSQVELNETLHAKAVNGKFTIKALPNLSVSPSSLELYSGESRQFSVSGGTAPYTWVLENDQLAAISQEGELQALSGGNTRAWAYDVYGAKGYCSLTVYDTHLKVRDTLAVVNNLQLKVPIDIRPIAENKNLIAFSGNLTCSSDKIDSITVSRQGTLSEQWAIAYNAEKNKCTFALSGSNRITEAGILLYAIIHFNSSIALNDKFAIACNDLLLNEGSPVAKTQPGSITVSEMKETALENIRFETMDVYLNPATDELRIRNDQLREGDNVWIYNISGRCVIKTLCATFSATKINLARLPSGVYFVKAGNYTGKFVKK
jgi:hypothetical protein